MQGIPMTTVLAGLLALATLSACRKSAPPAQTPQGTPPFTAAQTPAAPAPIAAAAMVDGARFLPFFPTAGPDGTTDRVERPAKAGYAEVSYRKGKDEVVVVTITDTSAEPRVRDDYAGTKERVGDAPLKTSGYSKTAMLVGGRFQVQVASPRLPPGRRRAWLEGIDQAALQSVR